MTQMAAAYRRRWNGPRAKSLCRARGLMSSGPNGPAPSTSRSCHELRTPLNDIIEVAELLREDAKALKQDVEPLDRVLRAAYL
jgi:hypothetical protein